MVMSSTIKTHFWRDLVNFRERKIKAVGCGETKVKRSYEKECAKYWYQDCWYQHLKGTPLEVISSQQIEMNQSEL